MTTPFDLFARGINLWASSARDAQKMWLQMATRQTEQMMPDEAQIREGFQKVADMNLSGWTIMAEKVSALPDWARAPVEVPGRTLTDMFDMFRPFPAFQTAPDAPGEAVAGHEPVMPPADDLTAIKGIGPKMAEKLGAAGIVSFTQIAGWKKADIQRLDAEFGLGARITRQGWVAQAKRLAKPVLH